MKLDYKSILLTMVIFLSGAWIGIKWQSADKAYTVHAASAQSKNELANIFIQISKKMIPSVVNIFTTTKMRTPWSGGRRGGDGAPNEMWRRFFEDFFGEPFSGGMPGPDGDDESLMPKAQSLGSGFIIEASNEGGLILTNYHVVEGADEIKVKFTEDVNEKETDAEVIGRDPDLDVALLKVKTRRSLQAVQLGDSSKLEVGEWIGAVGNPFGHGHTVTHGIVSATGRSLPVGFGKYLQVDAPINPGNSGGPLVNLDGDVVGINNAIDARASGIGFAIPIHQVKANLEQLKTKGFVDRGYIGIGVEDLSSEMAKALKLDSDLKAPIINHVRPGEPAEKAGLKASDVITGINGKTVYSSAELISLITSLPIGKKADITVLRNGKKQTFSVDVIKRPDFRREQEQKRKKSQGSLKKSSIDIGAELEEFNDTKEKAKGIVVVSVERGSPAFKAGLMRDDVIVDVNGSPVQTIDSFYKIVNARKTYLLRVERLDKMTGESLYKLLTLDLSKSK